MKWRAECSCGYVGPLRDTEPEAWDDCRAHQKNKPVEESHTCEAVPYIP